MALTTVKEKISEDDPNYDRYIEMSTDVNAENYLKLLDSVSWHLMQSLFQILTIAVLAIVITAPVGAMFIALAGPRLLTKSKPEHVD